MMDRRVRFLQNPNRRNAIANAARKIADPAPDWLIAGLEHFSDFVGSGEITKEREKDLMRIAARMHDAAACLTKFLPSYSHWPLGFRTPDDVIVAMDVLPRIRDDLARVVNKRPRKGGPRPNVSRKFCAAVIVEAWGIVHGEPEPYSSKLWTACNEYWQACGREYRGDVVDNWEDDAVAVADKYRVVRTILLALKERTL